jgi:hypothetical protein
MLSRHDGDPPVSPETNLWSLRNVRKISLAKCCRYSSIREKNDTKNGTDNDRNGGEKSNDDYNAENNLPKSNKQM